MCGCNSQTLQGIPWMDILQFLADQEEEKRAAQEEANMRTEARAQIRAQAAEIDAAEKETLAADREAKSAAKEIYAARRAGNETPELRKARIEADLAKAAARTQRQQIAQARAELAAAAREIGGDRVTVSEFTVNGETYFNVRFA